MTTIRRVSLPKYHITITDVFALGDVRVTLTEVTSTSGPAEGEVLFGAWDEEPELVPLATGAWSDTDLVPEELEQKGWAVV